LVPSDLLNRGLPVTVTLKKEMFPIIAMSKNVYYFLMFKSATPESINCFIVDRSYVLMRLRAENDLSGLQDVTGMAGRILAVSVHVSSICPMLSSYNHGG
jgi:hypothetical protein